MWDKKKSHRPGSLIAVGPPDFSGLLLVGVALSGGSGEYGGGATAVSGYMVAMGAATGEALDGDCGLVFTSVEDPAGPSWRDWVALVALGEPTEGGPTIVLWRLLTALPPTVAPLQTCPPLTLPTCGTGPE